LSILIKRSGFAQPNGSEITPKAVFDQRRQFSLAAAFGVAGLTGLNLNVAAAQTRDPSRALVSKLGPAAYNTKDPKTPFKDVSTYNNFYEFGVDKADPAQNAGSLKTRPWTVSIEGEVGKPLTLGIEDILKLVPLEERIYRLRCVEGWSMVIPWIGFPMSELIKRAQPNDNAKFVQFVTLADKAQMPGLGANVLDWPYTEGLRMDEAMSPLTLACVGLYGEVLPNQNGAPLRLVVPWKYGFKSAKSIVKIRLTEKQPATSWNRSAPHEYGFYSNVNPEVDHPRWSQASERRLGQDGFIQRRRKTLPFNGYADQVASLYQGMDLKKFF
jgi:methionine sulfoxide reductase catalytic subunit